MDDKLLADAIVQMDRRKVEEEVTTEARSALDVAASIGTETPLIILRDIRKCLVDLSNVMQESIQDRHAVELRNEERHREMLATLQQLSIQPSFTSSVPVSSMSRLSLSGKSMEIKQEYYYGGEAIKTGFNIIGLVLLQMDAVASGCSYIPNVGTSDGVIMDLKKWSSAVSIVYSCESNVTPMKSIVLPKLSDAQVKAALSKCASTENGRVTVFRVPELAAVCDSSPDLMAVVNEVKIRIVKCPGLISEDKRLRMAYVDNPITDRDSSLKVVATAPQRASAVVISIVSKLNHTSKKQYVQLILENKSHALSAAQKCRPD